MRFTLNGIPALCRIVAALNLEPPGVTKQPCLHVACRLHSEHWPAIADRAIWVAQLLGIACAEVSQDLAASRRAWTQAHGRSCRLSLAITR